MTTDGEYIYKGFTVLSATITEVFAKLSDTITEVFAKPKYVDMTFPTYPHDVKPFDKPDPSPIKFPYDKLDPVKLTTSTFSNPGWYKETTWVLRFYDVNGEPQIEEYAELSEAVESARISLDEAHKQIRIFERTVYVSPEKEYTDWQQYKG